jgi:hypothetical protein
MHKWLLTILAALLVCCWSGHGQHELQAENPLLALLPFRIIDADPNKSYPLRAEHGPWVIVASSFAGDGAEKQARELVYELRKRFKLEAFSHRRTYDFSKSVVGRGINQYGDARRMRYAHDSRFDEIAVLVGQFSSIDTSDAQDTLEQVKYLQPECLKLDRDGGTSQRMAVWREIQRRINMSADKRNRGPMGKAFLTINPLMPQDGSAASQLDPFIRRINEDVKFNLLDNTAPFTVRVASFRGKVTIDLERNFDKNSKISNKLVEAAENAHRLTMVLRSKGVDAYEFHDRHESIVTIGSFNTVGTSRTDGKIEIDPRILRIIETYKARRQRLPNSTQVGLVPRTLTGIPFDIQPVPVRVPR